MNDTKTYDTSESNVPAFFAGMMSCVTAIGALPFAASTVSENPDASLFLALFVMIGAGLAMVSGLYVWLKRDVEKSLHIRPSKDSVMTTDGIMFLVAVILLLTIFAGVRQVLV